MAEQLTEEREATETREVTEGPVRVAWAQLPRVNLLPIEIIENRRFRRTQMLLGAAVISSVLIAAGGTFWAQHGIDAAKADLLISQSRVAVLQSQQGRYSVVPKVISELDKATAARSLAMDNDVLWYRCLNDLYNAQAPGLQLSSLTLTLNAAGTGTGGNPLTPTGIGAIAVAGTTDQYSKISTWMETVDKLHGFASSSLTSASKSGETITFGSAAVISSSALSGRYDKKAG